MKRIILPVMLLLTVGLVTSCKKELDNIIPTNIFEETRAFTSVDDLEQGILGAYASYSYENTMYINALLSDEVKISSENRGQGQFEFKYQYNGSSNSFGFGSYYVTINRANRVLQAMDKVIAPNPAAEAKKSLLRAEALALRAYAHFELLQRFSPAYTPDALGVTYVDRVFISDLLPREKASDNIARIESDLAAAKGGPLPASPTATPSFGNIRISKAVVAGMQARVALFKKDYNNAASFATEALTLANKPLATRAEFPLIWTDETEAEVWLRLKRTGTGVGTLWQDINGDVFFEPSEKLKQQYNRTTDIRFTSYFLISNGPDTALIRKFFSSPRGPKIVEPKFMRTAEMHLIRAEARAENNDLVGAASDINIIRTARISNYVPVMFTSKDVAISEILNERYKELPYEGFRFFDLKRRNLGVNRLASDVGSTQWQSLAPNSLLITLPIPQSEILANPNFAQNAGY